ncbi:MAG TPA: hypothetical protein VF618_00495 [Thermoanaerobaculia bacterium]
MALALFIMTAPAFAQTHGFLSEDPTQPPPDTTLVPHPLAARCNGPVAQVVDVGYEGLRTTAHNFTNATGGGESGRFDKTPLLSTTVTLNQGVCLNAHLSAIVGSRQTYGLGISALTLFQVTVTNVLGGAPQHMFGHYERPYGIYGPAVAIEAERDVDTFGSNFFTRVGTAPGEVPPGQYRVDVWWAGGPATPGGAIGAAFVLKLYFR